MLTATARPGPGMPGGHSSLSANGDRDGIVWTCIPTNDGQWAPTPGTLAAFDALTLKEIWADLMPELFAKFNPPTIADGKVFRPVFAQYQVHWDTKAAAEMLEPGKVIVYGLVKGPGPHPRPPWRRWRGGGDPAPRFTIEERWLMHGGSGALAEPVGEEVELGDARGGRRRDFTGWVATPRGRQSVRDEGDDATCHRPPRRSVPVAASIFWSGATGARVVLGDIRDEYIRLGAQSSDLGYPVSDEQDTADGAGRASHFEHGSIVWYPAEGAEMHLHGF